MAVIPRDDNRIPAVGGVDTVSGKTTAISAVALSGVEALATSLIGSSGTSIITADGLQVVGNVASGATDSGNPVKVGGKYNSSPPTFTDGQRGNLQITTNGYLINAEFYAPVYEDNTVGVAKVENRYSYNNITTTTTTVVQSVPGFLHAIVINKPVASSVITIYDNTAGSGNIIGTITLPATLLAEGPISAIYDVVCTTGLTIVTGTAASDLTIVSRGATA